MNYIVLDSEWNSVYFKEKNKYINELVEIGAVKLDENLEVIDKFDCVIKSKLTNKLSSRFINLTNISNEEMLSGVSLEEAFEQYKKWAGTDTVTFTWSDSDLYTLYHNCEDLLGLDYIPGFEKYADAQKIVQNFMISQGFVLESQISLENAAHFLEVSVDNIELHRASDDSKLTSQLLKKSQSVDFSRFISDCRNSDFYGKIAFKPYVITDLNSKIVKKNKMRFKCDICKGKTKQITPWKFKNGGFNAQFVCKKCAISFTGVVIFKKYYNKISFKKFKKCVICNQKNKKESPKNK